MKENMLILERKKMSLCILAGICAVSLFVIINSGDKIKENSGGSFVIKIKHYGIDAAEMERSVTVPLEDALYSIPGIQSIQSSSENSLSSVFVRFKNERSRGAKGRYEAVRDAAQRIYETLPSSAQRPEILSSNNSRIPVWSAAFLNNNSPEDNFLTAGILEKTVKPRLESLEGAGEVLVSGSGLKEIYIIFDQEKTGILGLEPSEAALFLAMNDSIFSGGTLTQGSREIIVTVDGRYPSLEKALIPIGDNKFIELSEIAQLKEQEREPDSLSRLNGKKTASIAIMGQNDADLRKLSAEIKKELAALREQELRNYEFIVLSDLGAEEAAAFRSVLNAAVLGAMMAAVISFLLNRNNSLFSGGFFCALAIPLICLISAAILYANGFSLDRLLLTGIAAGVGTAIDAVILCSERLRKCRDYKSASESLSSLKGPLIAGGATTIAALIPLSVIEDSGVRIIAVSIAVVTVTALVLSLTILPPLLLWELKNGRKNQPVKMPESINKYLNLISHNSCKALAAVIRFCVKYPAVVLAAGIAVAVTAVFMLFAKGADTGGFSSEDSVFGQVEFEGGLLAEETDRHLAGFSEKLLQTQGIKNAETSARTGSGSLLISFDPKRIKPHQVREIAKKIYIPGGFIFFHENSIKERYWEIIIYGDEDKKCREIAEELALLCAGNSMIRERVLNFKEGSKKLILKPDREIFAESGIGFSNAANRLRLGVYGPVVYKRTESDMSGETDVRIKTGTGVMRQSREDVMKTLVLSKNENYSSSFYIDSLMNVKEEKEPSSIRRDNRRRSASVTISTLPMDPRRVKKELAAIFKKLDLPPGYSIDFDPEAVRQSESLSATVLSLVLAVIFCYMIIAAINESFAVPLFVLSAVPVSLAIPAIFLVLSGSAYNSAVACAFIAVSGMTVNAAILCVDGIKSRMKERKENLTLYVYLAIRKKIPALLSTTGTTVAGALPFLFLTEGANTLIRTLSLVGAIGVACSCLCSVTIIPSLISITNKKLFRLSGI